MRVLPDGTLAAAARLPGYRGGARRRARRRLLRRHGARRPARVWRVAPDGTRAVIAGSGPFTFTAPAGLEQRLTGESALGARLGELGDVAVLPDGGVLVAEESGDVDDIGGLVRYLAPAAPQTLAAAILRDRDRLISAHAVTVSLTVPATVTLRVAGRTVTRALPAGRVTRPAAAAAGDAARSASGWSPPRPAAPPTTTRASSPAAGCPPRPRSWSPPRCGPRRRSSPAA